jgi:GntR family transcriptional regulator
LTSTIGPDYRQVIDLIRSKITSGEWRVGRKIPSTPELIKLTETSITPVRRAVQQLQADGILEGHPGKGVFVKAFPEDADQQQADLKTVAELVAELARRTEGYDDLRAKVNRIEAVVINLCKRQGVEYPRGGARNDSTEEAPRRRQAGR